MLDLVYAGGIDRFPVDVKQVARDLSAQRFPGDAVTMVKGASLGRFDGALYKAPTGKTGWGIIYNDAIASKGRINFTLAHEFGHYLLHRLAHPDGIECGQQDMVRWDSAYREIEQQANCFAAGLLMPLNDYRAQIPAKARPTLDDIGTCADRYGTSLIAATLRWLEYAERRSLLVVSRDGYVLWSRASKSALRTGIYYRTSGRPPIPVPVSSLAAQTPIGAATVDHEDDVWFKEPCQEIALASDRYDFVVSLLHFDEASWRGFAEQDNEPVPDALAFMIDRFPRR
ncbi:ImmA/IrrE family metallo-endopeptidase [Novosphingobium sp. MD-1]|uniref:ImmA/IrrE family metallo-endopeptidase n=1 Tax=Novosphingobium sp. MD-1 TaxID=1630648 RepID=UPI00061C25F3|nr:ImmA/IrrE family metallo-endopeptidase [Novosphingobium sp. MD-1]GAO52949.1 hypothetical protein NMD1_00916 [Novosphingobium sp. MD-1]